VSRDWDHGLRAELAPHPAPIVRALEVGVDDARVPGATRSAWKLAERSGWTGRLGYALGTDLRPDGGAGAVVSSVALWCRARGTSGPATACATWLTRARAVCSPCGGDFLPTDAGLFRAHGGDVRLGIPGCEGGGQPALAARVDDPAAVTRTAFWHASARGHAGRLSLAQFQVTLRAGAHASAHYAGAHASALAGAREGGSAWPDVATEFRFAMAFPGSVIVIGDH